MGSPRRSDGCRPSSARRRQTRTPVDSVGSRYGPRGPAEDLPERLPGDALGGAGREGLRSQGRVGAAGKTRRGNGTGDGEGSAMGGSVRPSAPRPVQRPTSGPSAPHNAVNARQVPGRGRYRAGTAPFRQRAVATSLSGWQVKT